MRSMGVISREIENSNYGFPGQEARYGRKQDDMSWEESKMAA